MREKQDIYCIPFDADEWVETHERDHAVLGIGSGVGEGAHATAKQHPGRGRGLDARFRPERARAGAGGCVRTGPGRARMSARIPEHTPSNPFIPNGRALVCALRGVIRPERTWTRAPSGLVSALAVRTAPGAIPCGRRAKAPHPGLFWTSAPVQTARERDQVGRCSNAHASDTRRHATVRTRHGHRAIRSSRRLE